MMQKAKSDSDLVKAKVNVAAKEAHYNSMRSIFEAQRKTYIRALKDKEKTENEYAEAITALEEARRMAEIAQREYDLVNIVGMPVRHLDPDCNRITFDPDIDSIAPKSQMAMKRFKCNNLQATSSDPQERLKKFGAMLRAKVDLSGKQIRHDVLKSALPIKQTIEENAAKEEQKAMAEMEKADIDLENAKQEQIAAQMNSDRISNMGRNSRIQAQIE
ncbi:hypothetical protein DdX_14836 [Ditylenchus destructor]|uniref:Uncharacterized protein n=1 Tax=Ditylenchus destructor TaxID=166010 RepID=A0AAD4MQI9_9BILA|nr:hypothetical protein DdX_14836 [Ditylenchus destructor]